MTAEHQSEAKRPQVTVSLEPEVLAELNASAVAYGVNRQVLLVEAITTYLAMLDKGLRTYVVPGQRLKSVRSRGKAATP